MPFGPRVEDTVKLCLSLADLLERDILKPDVDDAEQSCDDIANLNITE